MAARVAVVLPIGPNCRPEFVADTLASIRAYTPPETLVVAVDDSRKGTAHDVADSATVVVPGVAQGSFGALYLNLAVGFRRALEDDFDVLLRIDTDALVAGPFADVAHAFFTSHPAIGSLGSHRFGYKGGPEQRSTKWQAKKIAASLSLRKGPRTLGTLRRRRMVARAQRNGYSLGESVMGGVALYSRPAIEALAKAGHLPHPSLAEIGAHEDHLFGLSLFSLGFGLSDFGSQHDDLPFAATHVGLPEHPDDLLAKHKALIHSVRSYGDLDEAAIRAVFSAARDGGA